MDEYVYEAIMILSPKDETICKAEIKKFTDLIQRFSKTRKVKAEDMGIKKLAYDVKTHKEGYYCVFTFATVPDNILELEREFRIDDHVLKFITLKTDYALDYLAEATVAESEQLTRDQITDQQQTETADIFTLIYGEI